MDIQEFRDLLKNNSIHIENQYLNDIIMKFSVHCITQDNSDEIQRIQQKNNNFIIVFDEIKDDRIKDSFFVVCFNYSIIIIRSSDILLLSSFFSSNKDSIIYYFTKGIKKKIPNYQNSQLHFSKLTDNRNQVFISNFFNECELRYDKNSKKIQELIWKIVGKSILVFLIQIGFRNSLNDQIDKREEIFTKNKNDVEIKSDEYINLGFFSTGSSSFCRIVYLIKKERICILKMFSNEDDEENILFKREHENYLNMSHPFIPQYYGKTEINEMKSLFIEYFEGETLDSINMEKISIHDKTKMLFDVMITIEYFHINKYIYRDLRPNNIIVDRNKTAYIIDFDRMVKFTDENECYSIPERTKIFDYSEFYSPELINEQTVSNKTDIYSLGKLISFFQFDKESKEYKNELKKLHEIELKCTKINENERPKISEIINDFYLNFYVKINNIIETDDIAAISKYHGELYSQFWYYIAESQRPKYQVILGLLYKDGFYIYKKLENDHVYYCIKDNFDQRKRYNDIHYIPQNINKCIHYFSLAANHNYPNAQFNLGLIYYDGKYIKQDINKAIQYFTLAANQNISNAQYFLALIYFKSKNSDINKAFYYYFLAAEKNHIGACYDLGVIYHKGIYVMQDIEKSIHYYTIAADQNFVSAQFDLGFIYLTKDIVKSLHYLTLAANQNHCMAQFILGVLYFNGEYISHDIYKAIFYFNLASKQNHREARDILEIIHSKFQKNQLRNIVRLFFKSVNDDAKAQYNIGCFYYDDTHSCFNINKALCYFKLASDNNNSKAQYAIGAIYYEGKCVKFDIKKSLHYFQLASNLNNPEAQFALGVIYYEGKYVKRDINKAVYYYKLASDQNHINAQFELGNIYYDDLYVNRDINKAIHYLSLAAAHNHSTAQYKLGMIYINDTFVSRNINKAINYFTLAANQNHTQAQYNLGVIYSLSLYTNPDVHKAIYFYSLAAKKKHRGALHNLGVIYYNGKYITRDIEKCIYYLKAAADLNHVGAQYNLGCIYYFGKYVAVDINKAIHFFSLSANQNHKESQYFLGSIYSNGKYTKRDINKAIQYYTQAANNNDKMAQNNLGKLFIEGKYVEKDVKKAIHYFSLASNLNQAESQFSLGLIYEKGIDVPQDINKSIYYYSLAGKQNDKDALYRLGFIYYFGQYNHVSNKIKGIKYFELSANCNHITSNFLIGYFYHEGKYLKRDIKKAIHYYKEASSFNDECSKNNLGILYKHGYGEEIKQNLGSAIIFFEEAIRIQKNLCIAIYNLAHLYFFNIKNEIDKSIHLLINASSLGCSHSKELLCIALVKKIGFDIKLIKTEIEKENKIKLAEEICQKIIKMKLGDLSIYEKLYEYYKNVDFVISPNGYFQSNDIMSIDQHQNYTNDKKIPKISKFFYEGFGIDA